MTKKKVESNKEQVTLDMLLKPVRVTVEAGTEKEMIERMKQAAIAEIEKTFPYSNIL